MVLTNPPSTIGPVLGTRGPCPVCTARPFRALFEVDGRAFERCRGCGFMRMAQAPTPAALADFYQRDEASARSALDDHDKNLQRFATILRHIERRRRPGRFVDVGCSIGTSLVVAQQRGWQAVGLEPSAAAVGIARRQFAVDARQGTLAEAGLARGSVDAVLMHHTLEHVDAPDVVVRQVFDLLAPGGVMYQSLPNHGSLKARLLGRHFGYGITDEHLSHFTKHTLRQLVQRLGFQVPWTATWSYRQDPRLLFDVCGRLGCRRWLERKCGVAEGQPMDVTRYIDFLGRTRWAFFVCNRLWPERLCRWLGLGEDLQLIAQKPR